MDIPQIGLGTFHLTGAEAQASVHSGLDVGYKHIDTAQIYDNEQDIGTAIQASGVSRNSLFLTTKIWLSALTKQTLIPSLEASLRKLHTDYVDLTLIHWPAPKNEVPLEETIEALLQAKEMNLTRRIGVSNFPVALVKEAIAIAGAQNIFTNQIELHPFLQNKKVKDYCAENGIKVTAYMPLAYGKVMKDEVLQNIARKYETTPAEVTLSWLLDQGLIVIPSSTKKENQIANINTGRGFLSNEDLQAIAKLDRGDRIVAPDFSPVWDE